MFDRQKQLSIVQRTFRKAMRNIINNIYRKYSVPEKWVEYRGQDASDIIEAGLKSDKPLMVARLGGIELDAMIRINNNNSKFKFLPNKKRDGIFDSLASNAGFFPLDDALLKKFYELMYADLHCVDILGSWRRREIFFKKELRAAKKIYLADIEPYLHINPWSKALKGKKVLVVHPFSESIREQYARRSYLFDNKDVLPEFELITVKAVQSIAGNNSGFTTWFDALDYMKNQVSTLDFDIAIIGCGAYGFPLAAHIKRMGKKAIHIGGATQILFGIKGRRWETNERIAPLMNDYWVRPKQSETPNHSSTIEGGCYW